MTFLPNYWVLIAATWYFINGLLHDVFVIKNHRTGYDRELLRLLMDGHVLMLSGAVLLVCWVMMKQQQPPVGAPLIGSIVALGMLIYCAMIFPFLKSLVTIIISTVLLVVCAWTYFA